MTDHQFYVVWGAAIKTEDKDAYVSEWALSSLFLPEDDPEAEIDPVLVEQLGKIWDAAHMSSRQIRETTGLSQVRFGERYCVPRRTVEGWESKDSCPDYVRLLLIRQLGLI